MNGEVGRAIIIVRYCVCAAAQVAFDKAGVEERTGMRLRKWAAEAGEAASCNHVLVLAAVGARGGWCFALDCAAWGTG